MSCTRKASGDWRAFGGIVCGGKSAVVARRANAVGSVGGILRNKFSRDANFVVGALFGVGIRRKRRPSNWTAIKLCAAAPVCFILTATAVGTTATPFIPSAPFTPFFILASWAGGTLTVRAWSWLGKHKFAGRAIKDVGALCGVGFDSVSPRFARRADSVGCCRRCRRSNGVTSRQADFPRLTFRQVCLVRERALAASNAFTVVGWRWRHRHAVAGLAYCDKCARSGVFNSGKGSASNAISASPVVARRRFGNDVLPNGANGVHLALCLVFHGRKQAQGARGALAVCRRRWFDGDVLAWKARQNARAERLVWRCRKRAGFACLADPVRSRSAVFVHVVACFAHCPRCADVFVAGRCKGAIFARRALALRAAGGFLGYARAWRASVVLVADPVARQGWRCDHPRTDRAGCLVRGALLLIRAGRERTRRAGCAD